MSHIELSESAPDRLAGDVLAVPLFHDERPPGGAAALVDWRFGGQLSRMLQSSQLSGRRGEQAIVPAGDKLPTAWVLFCGAGPRHPLTNFDQVVQQMAYSCLCAGYRHIVLGLPDQEDFPFSLAVQSVERAMRQSGCHDLDCTISYYPNGEAASTMGRSLEHIS